MKNLTHYFQVSKSPPDASEPVNESADTTLTSSEDQANTVEKCLTKPKKLSLKSKKSLLGSMAAATGQNSQSPSAACPSLAANSSVSAKKPTKRKRSDDASGDESDTASATDAPPLSFANNMQNILQRVLKKKFPSVSDFESPSSVTKENCDEITSPKTPKVSATDSPKNADCEEVSSSTLPKSTGKKRGRKPKKGNDDKPPGKELSYEELERELLKERILIARLKETFLESNPDEELLEKYNRTLPAESKMLLESPNDSDDSLDSIKSIKDMITKRMAEESDSASNASKSPSKTPLIFPKSVSKSSSKKLGSTKKSDSAKNTPANNTKVMKEVLEFLNNSESKIETPSPKKCKTNPSKSKNGNSAVKSKSKSKKQLDFSGNGVSEVTEESSAKKKKEVPVQDFSGNGVGKVTEESSAKKKKGTPKQSRKNSIKDLFPKKETSEKTPKGKRSPVKSESPAVQPEKKVKGKRSPVKSESQQETNESPAVQPEKPLKGKRSPVKSESQQDLNESPSAPPVKKLKGRRSSVKSESQQEISESPSVQPEKKRKRRKESRSMDDLEELIAPIAVTKEKNKKSKASELESLTKKKKIKVNPDDSTAEGSVGESATVVKKRKVKGKKGESEIEKSPKEVLKKKAEKSAKSNKEQPQKEQGEASINLDSSSEDVFVDSSQKVKGKKSDNESIEKKTSKSAEISQVFDNPVKNSLFKYFGKTDKTYMKKEEKSSCLTTKAVVHSPPVSPSKKRRSAGPPFSPRRKKLKSMLADADKIELLSSEMVPNPVFDKPEEEDGSPSVQQALTASPKWTMRVKLGVQSPSKTSNSDSASSKNKVVEDSSPESKVKRKLFSAKPPVEDADSSNSSNSSEVQVIEEKTTSREKPSSCSTKGEESSKKTGSSDQEKSTPKPPVKLASIFMKKSTPKTDSPAANTVIVIDEEAIQAKKDFLASGVPDKIKQKSEQLKALEKFEDEESFAPFPKVSHVGYDSSCSNPDFMLEFEKLFKFKPAVNLSEIVMESLNKSWKSIINGGDQSVTARSVSCSYTKCADFKRQQRYLKKQASNFPFDVFEKKFEKISSNPRTSCDQGPEMWTEKYKPQSAKEVLGNGAKVSELKLWLEEQKKSKKKSDGTDGSSDDFVSSDDDSSLNNRMNNVAVLVGPPGCGKTSSVYAVAKELNCKVLELNASCNRNGKKVLSELLEATQSHQVKQVSSILADMFSKGNKKSDKKKKKKTVKQKKSESNDPDSKIMSIILIEDSDLIFSDHDDGFISALSSLSTLSKRPVILVANSIQCSHLTKFIRQQCLLLEFSRPAFNDLRTWLQLISLAETVELPAEMAEKLIYETNRDVRRSLLNLQYQIQSTIKPEGNSSISWPLDVAKLWWQWPSLFLLSPLTIETLKKSKPLVLDILSESGEAPPVESEIISVESETVTEETVCCESKKRSVPSREDCLRLHSLASFVDNLALAELWSSSCSPTSNSEDPSPKSWHVNPLDSCLLNERTSTEHNGYESLSLALSHELVSRHAKYLDLKIESCVQSGLSPDVARWKSKHQKVEKLLLAGLPVFEQIDRRSAFCDYLPMIRSIGRSECLRLAGNSKRSNRFFNYLSGLNIHPDENQRTLMCNAFISLGDEAKSS